MVNFGFQSPGPWRGQSVYGDRFRLAVPFSFWVTPDSDSDDLEHRYDLTVDLVDGKLACTSLTASRLDPSGPPVTSEALRRAPVASWITLAAYDFGVLYVLNPESKESTPTKIERYEFPPAEVFANGMTDEALDAIAQVYAYCMVTGVAPSGLLLNRYGMSRPTASRWISTAKRRGILVDHHEPFGDDDA